MITQTKIDKNQSVPLLCSFVDFSSVSVQSANLPKKKHNLILLLRGFEQTLALSIYLQSMHKSFGRQNKNNIFQRVYCTRYVPIHFVLTLRLYLQFLSLHDTRNMCTTNKRTFSLYRGKHAVCYLFYIHCTYVHPLPPYPFFTFALLNVYLCTHRNKENVVKLLIHRQKPYSSL